MLEVPYVSQVGNDRRNDCGPAAALMLALYAGKGAGYTVDGLSASFDQAQDGTTVADIHAMLKRMGCTPADIAGGVYPHAALISYPLLPTRYDKTYQGLHWIVVIDANTYHDPLWPGEQGAYMIAAPSILAQATRRIGVLDAPSPQVAHVTSDDAFLRYRRGPSTGQQVLGYLRNGARVLIVGQQTDEKARVWYQVACTTAGAYQDEAMTKPVYDIIGWAAGWLITLGEPPVGPPPLPDISMSAIPASIERGQTTVLTWNAPGGVSATLDGLPVAMQASTTRQPAVTTTYSLMVAYADNRKQSKSATVEVVEPAQPKPTKPIITVNVLGGGQRAAEAMLMGAPGVSISFNPGHGRDLKRAYPDRYIMVRPDSRSGSVAEWRSKVELDSLPPGTIVLGNNENDSKELKTRQLPAMRGLGSGSPQEILDRSHFDREAWILCRDRNLKYAGGGFAVASVDMTDVGMVGALRQHYAPLWNAGMWFNLHCYMARDGSGQGGPGVPLMERFTRAYPVTLHGKTFEIRQSWWTAEWWRWFPALCGFDPRRSVFVADEVGIEGTVEMGLTDGGFAANPGVDMVAYLRECQRVWGLPCWFGDDGQHYPSPFLMGAVFCANGGEKWAGYEVGHRLGEFQGAFWR